ncbi:hypothetical protein R3P38DRAFT_3002365 [Favolaschia claudopus]|uniref:Secreted protein n=1 Tax=Favolaschia claudopus TaxID=2862362 RepID=A0AAW0AM94_9AGAR
MFSVFRYLCCLCLNQLSASRLLPLPAATQHMAPSHRRHSTVPKTAAHSRSTATPANSDEVAWAACQCVVGRGTMRSESRGAVERTARGRDIRPCLPSALTSTMLYHYHRRRFEGMRRRPMPWIISRSPQPARTPIKRLSRSNAALESRCPIPRPAFSTDDGVCTCQTE